MNNLISSDNPYPVHRYAVYMGLVWTILIVCLGLWMYLNEKHETRERVIAEALAHFNKDKAFRLWGASHGGVYVPVTEKTSPNPFLSHVPERDIVTPSGRKLTLINPAFAHRQIMADHENLFGVNSKATSLKLLNPGNAPDAWERKALLEFEAGAVEKMEFTEIEGEPFFRLMRPLYIAKDCLKCHAHQGYSVGDVRGGLDILLPMAPRIAQDRKEILVQWSALSLLWIVGLVGLAISNRVVIRRVRERDQALIELRQSQKMEVVGQLAGGIAHDFNNILQIISGYAELLKIELSDSESSQTKVALILKSTSRATSLVKQLLAFSRSQHLELQALDVNQIINEFLKILRRVLGERVELFFKPSNNLPPIYADQVQFEQILLNICINARDSMPRGGRIEIRSRKVRFTEADAQTLGWARPGDFAAIAITDNGAGMDREVLKKIFEPFFTTKKMGHGTGLGLATVYGIIKQHGGLLRVESVPEHGSTFELFFPVTKEPLPKKRAASAPTAFLGHGERILLAEDDADVRAMTVSILEQAGYLVTAAKDGGEAVERFRSDPDAFDLVLCDVVMPAKTGPEVYREIHKFRKDVPFVFISGYNTLDETDGEMPPDVPLVPKPFNQSKLLWIIREILDEKA